MGRRGSSPLLLLVAVIVATLSFTTANSSDADAIEHFTELLSNPPPSWVDGGDVCGGTFVGITCDGSGRVICIDLKNQGLSGRLTPFLSSLTELRSLELKGNWLTGAVPSLAGMASLTLLSLDDNLFSSLPDDFLKGLSSLTNLTMNNLPLDPWLIPGNITDCTAVKLFSAVNASVSGAIPDVLAGLHSLKFLSLSSNYLSGGLPNQLGGLTALEVLELDHQKLSGSIQVPQSLRHLKVFSVRSNLFSGPIPDFYSPLELFDIRDNLFTGLIPFSLTQIQGLQTLWLSKNLFQGPLPEFSPTVHVDVPYGNSFCLHEPGPCDPLVSTLIEICSAFGYPVKLAESWAGSEPCTNWLGVVCRSSVVVGIQLSSMNLSGIISPSLAKLSFLEVIDLSDNNLIGNVPDALTTLSNLELLNVSSNNLTVPLPKFRPSVRVIATTADSTLPGGDSNKKRRIWIIIGIMISAAVILIIIVCISIVIYNRRKKKGGATTLPIQMTTNPVDSLPVEKLPIDSLLVATSNFSEDNIVGEGGGGVVFKGFIKGCEVAIKKFKNTTNETEGPSQFLAEINVHQKVKHYNVVKLIAYCIHGNERILVYEYMPGGTLRQRLLQKSNILTWDQRMAIARDVALGIEYLHSFSEENFIHRDIKTDNVLLDQNIRAKISDFGLVKQENDLDKSFSVEVAGTFGYLAPEYHRTGRITRKIDVYAFGVILMELISGRKVNDESLHEDQSCLIPIFQKSVFEKENFIKIVDSTLLLDDEQWRICLQVAKLAHLCTREEPYNRPNMSDCVNCLCSLMDQWKPKLDVDDDRGCSSGMEIDHIQETWNNLLRMAR